MAQYPSGINPADYLEPFAGLYRQHLQHLQLKGLRPKTIEAYARAMRRIGAHFDYQVSALTQAQLADYFPDGHPKLLHLWPPKLLQAGRINYGQSEGMTSRAAASLSR